MVTVWQRDALRSRASCKMQNMQSSRSGVFVEPFPRFYPSRWLVSGCQPDGRVVAMCSTEHLGGSLGMPSVRLKMGRRLARRDETSIVWRCLIRPGRRVPRWRGR